MESNKEIEEGMEILEELSKEISENEESLEEKNSEMDIHYDMIEVIDHNIKEHLKQIKTILGMVKSTKSLRRILLKLLQAHMVDSDKEIKLKGNLEQNAYELCYRIESDKRALAVQAFAAALDNLPNEMEKQAKEIEQQESEEASQGEE